jgi:hypothetical protein
MTTQHVMTWCTRTQNSEDTKLKRQDSKDKLKMQEDKEAEVSVESHSHHQDGHASSSPITEARECDAIAVLIL